MTEIYFQILNHKRLQMMMPLETNEFQPDLVERKVWAKIDPPLPEGSWWELYEANRLVNSARLEKGQTSMVEVKVMCAKTSELTLRICVPAYIGKQCLVQEQEGGLVIIDTLEVEKAKPKVPLRIRTSAKPKKETC